MKCYLVECESAYGARLTLLCSEHQLAAHEWMILAMKLKIVSKREIEWPTYKDAA